MRCAACDSGCANPSLAPASLEKPFATSHVTRASRMQPLGRHARSLAAENREPRFWFLVLIRASTARPLVREARAEQSERERAIEREAKETREESGSLEPTTGGDAGSLACTHVSPAAVMVHKKLDNRIRVLIENQVKNGHRSLFIVVGKKALEQVVVLHQMLAKAQVKARPSVLWCYKKELGFST